MKVYCAFNKPSKNTYKGAAKPESPSNAFQPSLPKTNEMD